MDNPTEEEAFLRDWRNDLAAALDVIGRWHMPFGKYGPKAFPPHGVPLFDLPEEYLLWFERTGFPSGRLGQMLRIVMEIKLAGADEIFGPLRKKNGGRHPLRPQKKRVFEFPGD